MLILAIDTSGPALGAALWHDGKILAETVMDTATPHSMALMPLIDDLLGRCGLTSEALDAFACTTGPGSYTGIRIGISTVKAMAFAARKPAIGVSTLLAMAYPYAGQPELVICPAINARNHRIYAAAFRGGQQLIDAKNWLAADFVDVLGQTIAPDNQILVVGYPADAFRKDGSGKGLTNISFAPISSSPRPSAVAELASIRLDNSDPGLPQTMAAEYLSPSQAERMKARRG